MTTYSRKYVFLLIAICISLLLHIGIHNNLVSFVIAPFVIATLLAYTLPSAPLLFGLVLLTEMLSTLPPGIMTLALAIPFIIHRIFPGKLPQISLPFYLLVVSITLLQAIFVGIVSLVPVLQASTLQDVWQAVPVWPLVLAIGGTSTVSFVLLILWYELFPPQQEASLSTLNTPIRQRIQ